MTARCLHSDAHCMAPEWRAAPDSHCALSVSLGSAWLGGERHVLAHFKGKGEALAGRGRLSSGAHLFQQLLVQLPGCIAPRV